MKGHNEKKLHVLHSKHPDTFSDLLTVYCAEIKVCLLSLLNFGLVVNLSNMKY